MPKNRSKKRNGGAATVLPMSYFNSRAYEPAADPGHNLLKAIPPLGVRARIGGKRKTKKNKGGFVPSVMDGFAASASQYVVPVALFAGYKLMTRKGKRGTRRRGRHTRRR